MMILSAVLVFAGSCIAMPFFNDTHEDNLNITMSGNETAFFALTNTTENTTLPPTTTDENSFCAGYMPGETPYTYMRVTGGMYYTFNCTKPLIWSQEQCSCQAKQVEIEDPNCPHHRPYPDNPAKYERRVHGVWMAATFSCPPGQIWFQDRCWCDFDPSVPVPPIIEGPPEATPPPAQQTTAATTRQRQIGPRPTKFFVNKGIVIEEENFENTSAGEYCKGFRPGSASNTYQMEFGNIFYNFTCQPPLVWSQEECSCQPRPVVIEDPNCPHHRAYPGDTTGTKYQARAHGVWLKSAISCPSGQIWNQTNCWCDFGEARPQTESLVPAARPGEQITGPCFPIFNATFDYGIQDDSSFEFGVGREPWHAISLDPNVEGAHGGTARVNRGRMPLWFTGGNDFGGKLQIEIRFMVIEGSNPPDEDIIIMSNEKCAGGPRTLAITYRPSERRYTVFFRDTELAAHRSCRSRFGDPYGFHHIDLVFFNELLTLTVDGVECFGSALYKSGMMPTACFIGIGGRNFDGYFDEVVFRRGCLEEETA